MERLDPDQIYDPNNGSIVPKVKQIFRISKEHRNDVTCRSKHFSQKLRANNHGVKCLTEVGQAPAMVTLEPPVINDDDQ